MAERAPRYLPFLNTLVLVGFGWMAMLIELAPLGRAGAEASPDLLFAVAAFLVLRRPASTPTLIIILLGLARDIIGGGPAGLGALTLLFGVEVLRAYGQTIIRRGVIFEVVAISGLAAMMAALQATALTVTLTPLPALEIIGLRIVDTVVGYIAVVIFFRFFLRIRADAPESTRLIGRAER